MYETFGERLAYCRSLLGLSRPQLVNLLGGINKETLARWERNEVTIPIAQLERIENFYKNSGIKIDRDWLLNGTGNLPINNNLNRIQDLNFDDISYLAYSNLKQNFSGTEYYLVNSDFYSPVINFSEYITGIKVELSEKYANQICYTIDKNGITVGLYNHKSLCLINIHNKKYKLNVKDKNFMFGKVILISKRF